MSLRDLVTGNDACTPDDGAGPSNAFAGLANSLLGSSSQKQQERLSELPGFQGLPGTAEARFAPQRPEDAALAAAESEQVPIPGISQASDRDVNEFLHGPSSSRMGNGLPWHAEFQDAFGLQQPPGAGPPRAAAPLEPFLHAFFSSARANAPFQLLPSAKMNLSVDEQCRIRDRSTIMARHIFAESGDDAFADEQVGRLLQSLHIDPMTLPGQSEGSSWDNIFQNGAARRDGQGMLDVTLQNRIQNSGRPAAEDRWADQFADLNLQEGLHSEDQGRAQITGDEMMGEFLREQQPGGNLGWAEEFQNVRGAADWANEFGQAQVQPGELQARDAAGTSDALQQTRALRDTLASSSNPKFRHSKFLQFVSKMSRGEIILEDNQAKEIPATAVGNLWAEEHANEAREAQFEEAWSSYNQQGDGGRATWADEFYGENHPQNGWIDQFGRERVPEDWAAEFADRAVETHLNGGPDQGYQFQPDNPFLSDAESFAKGKELFKNGLLSEAVLALEAEVQRQPGKVEAWRLLGTVHAENDDDQQAIAALRQALQAAPRDSEALLSLGVSHTNELDQARALTYLMEWLRGLPGQAAAASVQLPRDAREKLRAAVDIFRGAAQRNAGFADIHVALGVLFSLSRDFDGAVTAFRTALQVRSTDYSLWNKLGATLANSGRSGEAISAYQKALDLKPNYMRAWANMGISQANIGEYEQSARFYVRALGLNPRAANVWGYLSTSLTCAGRNDLIQAVEDEDLRGLQQALTL